MKKILSAFAALIIAVTVACPAAKAAYNGSLDRDFYSDCVLLICTDNDEIIFQKNINKQSKPASLTKIVTAIVVLENCDDINAAITIPESCIRELDGTGSSLSGLSAGETVTVYDLLCCLLLPSANDAATTLANYITGDDRQAFVDKMNAVAADLGCTNTHFVNCHGLDDDDQYTTVYDMAKLLKKAMSYSVFEQIVQKPNYEIPETNLHKARTINTTNFTLLKNYKDYYCPNSIGGKTGFTSGAGHCLASCATKDGYNYTAVCMNSVKEDLDKDMVEENGAFVDTKLMYDWAFDNLRLVSVTDNTKIVGEVPVKYGKSADYVTLCPSDTAFGLMPKGTDADSLLIKIVDNTVPKALKAPVKKGQQVCKGEVLYAGEVISTIDLVASTDIKRSLMAPFAGLFSDVFSSAPVKIILAALTVVLIILLVIGIGSKKKKSSSTGYHTMNYNDFKNLK